MLQCGLRIAMCPAYFGQIYIDYQLANISSIGSGIVKARGHASFFKQTCRQTGKLYIRLIYIYIYIYLYNYFINVVMFFINFN